MLIMGCKKRVRESVIHFIWKTAAGAKYKSSENEKNLVTDQFWKSGQTLSKDLLECLLNATSKS